MCSNTRDLVQDRYCSLPSKLQRFRDCLRIVTNLCSSEPIVRRSVLMNLHNRCLGLVHCRWSATRKKAVRENLIQQET
jgi:hypothetical protein